MITIAQKGLQNSGIIILRPARNTMAIGGAIANTGNLDLTSFGIGGIAHTGNAIEVKVRKAAAHKQRQRQHNNQQNL